MQALIEGDLAAFMAREAAQPPAGPLATLSAGSRR